MKVKDEITIREPRGMTLPEPLTPRRLRPSLRLLAYNAVMVLASPVVLAQKAARYWRRKTREFARDRWVCPLLNGELPQDARRPRVVFVGATFGEMLIMDHLSKSLRSALPEAHITWAMRDMRTIKSVQASKPDQTLISWPFDFIVPVSGWINRLSPDVVVIVEKFWYPNLIWGAHLSGVNVVVANGRTNPRTRPLHHLFGGHYSWIMSGIKTMCLQSDEHTKRLKRLMPSNTDVRVTGNIKFDLPRVELELPRLQQLRAWLDTRGDKALLAAGSTAPEEEEFVIEAFLKVRERVPCALLIAPRSLNRVPKVVEIIKSYGLKMSRRTDETPMQDADVYLLDTIGELASAYQFAQGAFVGGTLRGAGHNVLEPILWDVPCVYGPVRGHFDEVQRVCEAYGVGFRVHTHEELTDHWISVLSDSEMRRDIAVRAQKMMTEQRGAIDKTLEAMVEAVEDAMKRRGAPLR